MLNYFHIFYLDDLWGIGISEYLAMVYDIYHICIGAILKFSTYRVAMLSGCHIQCACYYNRVDYPQILQRCSHDLSVCVCLFIHISFSMRTWDQCCMCCT